MTFPSIKKGFWNDIDLNGYVDTFLYLLPHSSLYCIRYWVSVSRVQFFAARLQTFKNGNFLLSISRPWQILFFFAAFPASSEATHPLSLATGTGRLQGCQEKIERPQEEMGARLGEWQMVEGRFFFSQGGKALQVRVISQERGRKLGRRRWKRGRWKRDLVEAGGWWKRGLGWKRDMGGRRDLGEAGCQFHSEAYAGGRQCVLIPLKNWIKWFGLNTVLSSVVFQMAKKNNKPHDFSPNILCLQSNYRK